MAGLVIADDEYLVRQGLSTIPWNNIGIKVLGMAANGIEALSLIRHTNPQIVLTDIRMPGLDGLELIKNIKNEQPNIKTILLTGYQDFNYMREAIELQTISYVLKPSDPDEIINAVLKAKNQIEKENRKQKLERSLKNEIKKNQAKMFDLFLHDLIYGRLSDHDDLIEQCRKFHFNPANYWVLVIRHNSDANFASASAIPQVINEEINSKAPYYYLVLNASTSAMILQTPKYGETVKQYVNDTALNVVRKLLAKKGIQSSIGISANSSSIFDMAALFNQARKCVNVSFSLGFGCVIHIEDLVNNIHKSQIQLNHSIKMILTFVGSKNYFGSQRIINDLMRYISHEMPVDEEYIKNACMEIIHSLLRLQEEYVHNDSIYSQCDYYALNNCQTIQAVTDYLLKFTANIIKQIDSKNASPVKKVITDTIEYIEKNYPKDLTLAAVAKHVHLNQIYLARIFKKNTGETFLDILTRIRMQKACELLKDPDIRVYEVSQRVGFKDERYFSQVFKKYYNITPTEYRHVN